MCVAWGWPLWEPHASYLGHLLEKADPHVAGAEPLDDTTHLAGWLALVAAAAGAGLAVLMYGTKKIDPAAVRAKAGALYGFFREKWHFDELYDAVFVRPAMALGYGTARFDKRAVPAAQAEAADRTVNVSSLDGVLNAVGSRDAVGRAVAAGGPDRAHPRVRDGAVAGGRRPRRGARGRVRRRLGRPSHPHQPGAMIEYDLVLMSLVIFVPAAFGLLGLLFPAKWAEAIRWWALVGTALTLILSLCLLIEYYALLDSRSDRGLRSLHHPKTQLDARVDEAMRREANATRGAVPGVRLGGVRPMDLAVRRQLRDRRGRLLDAAHPAHERRVVPGRHRVVEDREGGEVVLRAPAAHRNRRAGDVLRDRPAYCCTSSTS